LKGPRRRAATGSPLSSPLSYQRTSAASRKNSHSPLRFSDSPSPRLSFPPITLSPCPLPSPPAPPQPASRLLTHGSRLAHLLSP